MIGKIIICCLLFSLNVAAQERETIDSVSVQDSTKTTFMDRIHQLQQFLDDKAKKKVDPRYIEVPDKPWRVILRYKENGVDVDYDNVFNVPELNYRTDWKLSFNPPTANSVGFWVGYRGTGISYSFSLAKNAGRYFSISSTGARYGFNFRLRRFRTSEATSEAEVYHTGQLTESYKDKENLASPVWIRSVYLNGYYVFNGRRYSQSAAYNQAVIQRRSAGSFLLGATWYQSSLDFSDMGNAAFIFIGNNVGRIKVHQANIGFGYGYNFVPFRGFVINAMVMPTLNVYNRVKVYKNEFNYALPIYTEQRDDYGSWNKETKTWDNGLTKRPLVLVENENGEVSLPADFDMWSGDSDISYSWLRLNFDLRLGIAYNWSRYFIGFQSQFNNFTYKKDLCKVTLTDWYARLSMGVRF